MDDLLDLEGCNNAQTVCRNLMNYHGIEMTPEQVWHCAMLDSGRRWEVAYEMLRDLAHDPRALGGFARDLLARSKSDSFSFVFVYQLSPLQIVGAAAVGSLLTAFASLLWG